ncbi:MAG TPA: hypothetical protein PLS12_03100 [Bacteroidales bacterium]|nr:hypothetical protein [Bacteroidales bacterium]
MGHSTEPDVFVMSHTYDEALGMAKKYFTQKNTPKPKNKSEKSELLKIKELPVVCSESFIKNPKLYMCCIRENFLSNEYLYILSHSYDEAASFFQTLQKQKIYDEDSSLIKRDNFFPKGIVQCDIINYELGLEVVYDRV